MEKVPWHMFAAIGKGRKGLGPNSFQDSLSKWRNIVRIRPIDLEGMPPTNGLLAGIMCLSPTLAGLLRIAIVAHVGNMEDEGA